MTWLVGAHHHFPLLKALICPLSISLSCHQISNTPCSCRTNANCKAQLARRNWLPVSKYGGPHASGDHRDSSVIISSSSILKNPARLPFETKRPRTPQATTSCAMLIRRESVRSTVSFVYWRACLRFEVNAFPQLMVSYTPFQIRDHHIMQSSIN